MICEKHGVEKDAKIIRHGKFYGFLCRLCRRENYNKYMLSNKGRFKEYKKQWQRKNKSKKLEYNNKYYNKNTAKILEMYRNTHHKRVSELSEIYIKHLMCNQYGIGSKDITQDMVVMKRDQLVAVRTYRKIRKEIGNEKSI